MKLLLMTMVMGGMLASAYTDPNGCPVNCGCPAPGAFKSKDSKRWCNCMEKSNHPCCQQVAKDNGRCI